MFYDKAERVSTEYEYRVKMTEICSPGRGVGEVERKLVSSRESSKHKALECLRG